MSLMTRSFLTPFRPLTLFIICGLWSTQAAGTLAAQDLEPRAFSPAPVGLNIAVLAAGYSKGNVLFDDALPVEDVTADVGSISALYVRTLDFFGLSSKVAFLAPFAWGDWEGQLEGQDTSTSRSGFADPRITIAVSFIGAPALSLREFTAFREGTVVGVSLHVIIPLGQYDPGLLINLGSNRWAFKPRLGISHTAGRWTLEAFGSLWLFSENTDFFGGQTLEQDPLWTVQGHLIYSFRPGLWLGLDAGYGDGGKTTLDGVEKDDIKRNTRLGGVLALPLSRRHSLKLVYVSGFSTRLGADYDTVQLAYQYRWGGGL
jgi:hypothetical protein